MARTQHTNRLIDETSPYLLQHAHNPVDWYPWGSEAFDAARKQDKPIFLSVGYSTCYWCHVMERECFESEPIAAVMNEHFINIKVDREERPDVDDIYMTAVQLMTHQGGWPMSLWLEPQSLKPFLGGTYFPPEDHHGRAGFPTVLRQIAKVWNEQREAVVQQADNVAEAVAAALNQEPKHVALRPQYVEQAVRAVMRSYDEVNAGLGGSGGPKFPMPANLDLLIHTEWDKPQVRRAILHTLDRMATGGIYDHIGGGFHRYSVDEHWLVPHFEKMLYDNGQLLSTYATAYELTRDPLYARVLRQTCEYVLREMTDVVPRLSEPRGSESRGTTGAFYSAQDAEVNHREGENYLWTATQVREALAAAGEADLSEFALEVYGFNRGTNFRDPHHGEDGPKNVVYLIDKPRALAQEHGMSLEGFFARLDHVNKILLEERDKRDQPATDDKVIAAWDGMMIAGMADAGRVLGESRYCEAAQRAATFVLSTMLRRDGGLVRTWRLDKAGSEGFLEDYAQMIHGLLALHRATADEQLLRDAMQLHDAARDRFWDDDHGGYFDTLAGQSDLFVRIKGIHDGAVPSGNSVMMLNLLRLRQMTGEVPRLSEPRGSKSRGTSSFLDDAVASMRCFSSHVAERPTSVVLSVLALHRLCDEHPEATKPLAVANEGAESSEIVKVTAQPREVDLSQVDEAAVEVTLHIAEGYHVNAHEPGLDFLVPLSIEIEEDGVELEVQYPPGKTYSGAVSDGETMRVYNGTVVIPLRLRKHGEIELPVLRMRYQACMDEACLEPREIALPLTITG